MVGYLPRWSFTFLLARIYRSLPSFTINRSIERGLKLPLRHACIYPQQQQSLKLRCFQVMSKVSVVVVRTYLDRSTTYNSTFTHSSARTENISVFTFFMLLFPAEFYGLTSTDIVPLRPDYISILSSSTMVQSEKGALYGRMVTHTHYPSNLKCFTKLCQSIFSVRKKYLAHFYSTWILPWCKMTSQKPEALSKSRVKINPDWTFCKFRKRQSTNFVDFRNVDSLKHVKCSVRI